MQMTALLDQGTQNGFKFHQCYHRNLQKGQSDGQCRKIQNHDLPVRVNSHRNCIAGFQSEEHRIGGHVLGASTEAHPISVLQVDVDGWFHDGPHHKITWDRASD